MQAGGSLTLSDPVSRRILRTQREFQAVQRAWSLDWGFGDAPLQEVEVLAPTLVPEPPSPPGRVAVFFSGGVDSWSSLLDNEDVTDLIFVRGIDIVPGASHQEGLGDVVEKRLREAAEAMGLTLHVVETNVRELSDRLAPWETYYGCAVVAVALFLSPLFERILIAGDSDYEMQVAFGANRMVDQLWSSERLEIVDDGGRYSRVQRVERVARNPVVQRTLRVCWENQGGAYNCGRCRKCLMTMITLEALGLRDAVTTFPADLDLAAVEEIQIPAPVTLHLWEDVLDAARAAGRTDLERAVEPAIAKAKREQGLPPGYRGRRLPGPPPTVPAATTAELFATAETARALAEAGAAAILVGSFDGSGNYGDIAQFEAAMELLGRLGGDVLVLPVLERSYLADYRDLHDRLLHPPAHALFFGGEGDDDLVPVGAPAELGFAAVYLYGGGFLNASWGERKLAMLRSSEALLNDGGAGRICRISSGQQVEGEWIAKLGHEDAERLRGFELLGSRDPASSRALAQLGGVGTVLETGDDAVGVLCRQAAEEDPTASDGRLHLNVHFAEHEWVTGRPREIFDFYADFLVAVGRRASRPLTVHPLIAYADRRIDERPASARLSAALSARGIEVAEPSTLRPGSLGDAAPQLRGSLFSLSCSYHVALTSLMLEVPAVLLQDNPYYEQKAAGLIEAFGLPRAFALSSAEDPGDSAERIASLLLDEDRAAPLRAGLARTAGSLRRRRADAEAQLLGRLAAAEIATGRHAARADAGPPARGEAERRAEEAERAHARTQAELHGILSSRSWRVAAPLRRLAAWMRRWRGRRSR
jgi:hypothetical protein